MMLLGTVLGVAGLVQTTSSHENGGNQSCPDGTVLLAKFDYVHGYFFEGPLGNSHVVTITSGTASGGNFHSTTPVLDVIVKGGPAAVMTTFSPPR